MEEHYRKLEEEKEKRDAEARAKAKKAAAKKKIKLSRGKILWRVLASAVKIVMDLRQ